LISAGEGAIGMLVPLEALVDGGSFGPLPVAQSTTLFV